MCPAALQTVSPSRRADHRQRLRVRVGIALRPDAILPSLYDASVKGGAVSSDTGSSARLTHARASRGQELRCCSATLVHQPVAGRTYPKEFHMSARFSLHAG